MEALAYAGHDLVRRTGSSVSEVAIGYSPSARPHGDPGLPGALGARLAARDEELVDPRRVLERTCGACGSDREDLLDARPLVLGGAVSRGPRMPANGGRGR